MHKLKSIYALGFFFKFSDICCVICLRVMRVIKVHSKKSPRCCFSWFFSFFMFTRAVAGDAWHVENLYCSVNENMDHLWKKHTGRFIYGCLSEAIKIRDEWGYTFWRNSIQILLNCLFLTFGSSTILEQILWLDDRKLYNFLLFAPAFVFLIRLIFKEVHG